MPAMYLLYTPVIVVKQLDSTVCNSERIKVGHSFTDLKDDEGEENIPQNVQPGLLNCPHKRIDIPKSQYCITILIENIYIDMYRISLQFTIADFY